MHEPKPRLPPAPRERFRHRDAANRECGYPTTPPGFLWYHDQEETMQLIPLDIYLKTGQTGGLSTYEGVLPLEKAIDDLYFQRERPAAGNAEIASFERTLGFGLPEDYRRFLLERNGGIPQRSYIDVPGCAADPIETVQVFFGFCMPWPATDINDARDLYAGALPAEIVPIAANGGGDFFVLEVDDEEVAIHLWNTRHFWMTGELRLDDFHRVAGSFKEFLWSLRATPDPVLT